uniref:Uncharacterized protein n=1 Tax=Arundo donax TaxID=35708 RepID=A0A0A9EMC0_ARUDO
MRKKFQCFFSLLVQSTYHLMKSYVLISKLKCCCLPVFKNQEDFMIASGWASLSLACSIKDVLQPCSTLKLTVRTEKYTALGHK